MQHLTTLIITTLLVRVSVILLLPPGAYSLDLQHYLEIQVILDQALNPYVETSYLNYAPLWVQFLWLLRKASDTSGIPREVVIKLFYATVDSVSVCFIYLIGISQISLRRAFLYCMFGFALNPVILMLSCVHGSFDSLVACGMLGTIFLLIHFHQQRDCYHWYAACLTLGYAILAKTVPILFLPLLLATRSFQKTKQFILGVIICGTPILVGLSTAYVLFPLDIKEKVLGYSSIAGFFGITGLFRVFGFSHTLDSSYLFYFTAALALLLLIQAVMLIFTVQASRYPITSYIVFNFLFLVTLGPGYGPQYLFWIFPLLLLQVMNIQPAPTYRIAVFVFYVIAVATVLNEYTNSSGLSGTMAMYTPIILTAQESQKNATLERLPLFFSMLVLLVLQLRIAIQDTIKGSNPPELSQQ